ncbi:MAG: hypothetical protein A2W26_11875 [Acidobacteria bacterium RBG_16_64_8]|nr:MAG: hypothetical protein A2W26_11875 [Acidobacteria bacterium RBG_16_64_8]
MTGRRSFRWWTEEEIAQPTLVDVRNAAGERIATIDPITRQRRDMQGRLERVLTPQGWNLVDPYHKATAIPHGTRPRVPYANYEPRHAKTHRITDRDSRSGYSRSGVRRKTGRRRSASA